MGCIFKKQTTPQENKDTRWKTIAVVNKIVEPKSHYLVIREERDGCQCLFENELDNFHILPNSVFSINIYEQLFENGFVRSAGHFERYKSNNCCCSGYNSRVDALKNTPTHRQQSIILHFLQVIQQIQNGTFEKEQENLKKQRLEQLPVEIKKQKIHPQTKLHQVISQDSSQEIKLMLSEIQSHLLQCKIVLKSEQFQPHEYDFQLNANNQIKVFYNSESESYYTNHNQILLHQNKIEQKDMNFGQTEFNILLGQQLQGKSIIENKYVLSLKKRGYLSIIKQDFKLKPKQKIKIQQIIKKPKTADLPCEDLIDKKSFTFEVFYVGKMKITQNDVEYSEEILKLYYEYMEHVQMHSGFEKYFLKNYVNQVLSQNEYLVDPKSKKKLQLGQRFMEYRIDGVLIGVDVIILTTKHLISEYLFYKPSLKQESFGIFSALVEINYVKQIQKIFPQFQYQSLSMIVSEYESMSYKMQFNSLQVQCCNTYDWVPLNKQIKEKMKAHKSQLSVNQQPQNIFQVNDCTFYYKDKYQTYDQLDEIMQIQVKGEMSQISSFIGLGLMKQLVFEISGY